MGPEILCIVDDLRQDFFFIRLEWKMGNLVLPQLKIFELRTSGIARNLDSPVADGTCIFLIVLNFTPGDLQTFAMVPT